MSGSFALATNVPHIEVSSALERAIGIEIENVANYAETPPMTDSSRTR